MSNYRIRYGGATIGFAETWAVAKHWFKQCLKGNFQLGKEGELMEKEAAAQLGVKYGLLANSGSSAGLLALQALELPKGSEVIIPAVTFPTIFNIILQCGLRPVAVDCEVGTYNLNLDEVEKALKAKGNKIRAIIAVHAVGNPVDMPCLMRIVEDVNAPMLMKLPSAMVKVIGKVKEGRKLFKEFNKSLKEKRVYVLEDNCDGWGGTINGKKVGSFGDVSFTSFHAAHIVAMGEGGGVFTDNPLIAKNARMYRDWGRQADLSSRTNNRWKTLPKDYDSRFIYEKVGYNLKPLEIQAVLGRVQLKKAEKIKEMRRKNFEWLDWNLGLRFMARGLVGPEHTTENVKPCWFALPLTYTGDRGKLVAHLEKNGIETRSLFMGNATRHPAYKKGDYRIHGKLKGADYILEHSFWIGVHPRMTQGDREYVVKVFDDFFRIDTSQGKVGELSGYRYYEEPKDVPITS